MAYHGALTALPPLAVAVPILMGCLLLVSGRWLTRPVVDLLAMATAAAVTALTAVLTASAMSGRILSWIAGWYPRHGRSVGIVMVADPMGAGLACLVSILVFCALLYSWRYFEDAEAHYHVLMLLFLAGMVGFALSGDVFNMFVFFELMGAVAYALTGFRIEEPDSVQGALNFGVINSLGAYLSLMGVGMLYARTGNLSLASLRVALDGHRPDALVVMAFVLVCCGFLVKAAMVPLHFWLADAHAVAPTPVCLLFSGVMVELGVYAVARLYWVVFAGTLPDPDVRRAFLILGILTAILGAVMCLAQRHLKRLLAYSTIAHIGLFLVGFALLDPAALAGSAVYVVGHAGIKSALFLLAGVLLNRYGSVDEAQLYGRAGHRNLVCWLFLVAGVALGGLPPFGPGLGKAIAEDAAAKSGYVWLPALFVLVSAVTAGAVLRAGLRIFLGWGRHPEPQRGDEETTGGEEQPETTGPLERIPVPMLASVVLLMIGGLATGAVPAFASAVGRAAVMFTDGTGYLAQALHAAPGHPAPEPPDVAWSASGVLLGVLSAVLAVLVAAAALVGLPGRLARPVARLRPALVVLHRLHSGHVGDYVAWMFVGTATLAALIAVPALR